MITTNDQEYAVKTWCILCNRSTTDANRFNCGYCAATYHTKCATSYMKDKLDFQIPQTKSYDIYTLVKWVKQKFSPPSIVRINITKPDATPELVYQDKKSLRIGFVNPRWPRRTFLQRLVLFNSGFTDVYMVRCKNCQHNIEFYGKRSIFVSLDRFFNCINSACYALPLILTGLATCFLSLITVSGMLSASYGWLNDMVVNRNQISLKELLSLLIIPHTFYCLVTSNVSYTNLLASCVYSWFNIGIPITGITNYVKKFLQFKLLNKVIYHLTFNKYYYESFKETPPILFGLKLSAPDAWDIQNYRNQYLDEDIEAEGKLSLFDSLKKWCQTQYFLFNEDFIKLYQITTWDYLSEYADTVFALLFGFLFQYLPIKGSIYLTDDQNIALISLIGFGIYQISYFIYSNYNACALARCYNTLSFTSNVEKGEANRITNFIYVVCKVLSFQNY